MNYDDIKANLANARAMLDEGNVAGADALTRSMVGKGLTGRDLDMGLSDAQRKTLREFSKPKRRAGPKLLAARFELSGSGGGRNIR